MERRDSSHESLEAGVQARLEEVYRFAPVGLCLVDAEFRFRRINDRLAAINGHPAGDHIGRTVQEVIPEFADQILPRYRKVLETGERIENVEVSDATTGRTWLTSDHPVRDRARGKVTGIMTVVQDITEMKRVEQAVETGRNRLRRAERVANLGCWEWDVQSSEIWWSNQMYRIFERDPHRFTPTFEDFIEQIVSEDRAHVREQLDEVWAGRDQAETEFRIAASDGSDRWLRSIATLRRDEEGEPHVLFGTTQDISESLRERAAARAERDALAREIEQLEALLCERTSALDRALDQIRRKHEG